MSIIIAGMRGGIQEDRYNDRPVEFVRSLLTGQTSRTELEQYLFRRPEPRTLTFVVNNACNLRCAHCYLQVDRLTDKALSLDEWDRVLDSVCHSPPELICLCGKEVFLGDLGPELLSQIHRRREESGAYFRLGVITNGTLIGPHRQRILDSELAYLDISIDGLEEEHDAVRGAGAFALAKPNIKWAAEAFGDRMFASCTIQKRNFERLPAIVEGLGRLGVRNIGFGFYKPLAYTDPSLQLNSEDINLVFDRLSELGEVPLSAPAAVSLDLDTTMLDQLLPFLGSRWFSLADLKADRSEEVFVPHELPNGLKLNFRFAPFPTGSVYSARITPEGNYLLSEDTLNAKNYAESRIGNVREVDFDLAALHMKARKSHQLREHLDRYREDILPQLIEAVSAGTTMGA